MLPPDLNTRRGSMRGQKAAPKQPIDRSRCRLTESSAVVVAGTAAAGQAAGLAVVPHETLQRCTAHGAVDAEPHCARVGGVLNPAALFISLTLVQAG